MQARPEVVVEADEIGLIDIYDLIRDGFKTLLGMSVLGLLAGLIVGLLLPAKYEASGLIDTGWVGFASFEEGVGSREIESLAVLAEKMKAPGFYTDKTIAACGLVDKTNPRQDLVKDLSPSVARNSSFVSVTYQAESVEKAKTCIDNVLADVATSQAQSIKSVFGYTQAEIINIQKQLEEARSLRDQQRVDRDQSLNALREQIAIARRELKALDETSIRADASGGSLAAVRVLNKQGEIQSLESALVDLQSDLSANVSERADQINRLTNRLTALQAAIEFPNTRQAQFATPVFASDTKVSPRRGLIVVIGLFVGGFLGLMILVGRRVMKHIRAHEALRREQTIP